MRYKVGAEQLQQVPSLVYRPDTVFRAARAAPVGPTHAVCAATGTVVCGIDPAQLEVLNEDWEAACFVEKCPECFAATTERFYAEGPTEDPTRQPIGQYRSYASDVTVRW